MAKTTGVAIELSEQTAEAGSNIIYLVDGSGYIFRAYHAIPPLSTSEGFPTNALYGFQRMIVKLLDQVASKYIAVVFDAGRETFRTQLFPAYKANRAECPADLVPQMPLFRDICQALGLPVYEKVGFEADDIIATLAHRLAAVGKEVVVVTADKDLMQIVEDGVTLWDTMRDRRSGRAEVKTRFGVGPDGVADVLALSGDSSDNIPGLKGVGDKTAAQLVNIFGDVEEIISSVERLAAEKAIRGREKIAGQIRENHQQLLLNKQLALVDRNVPLDQIGINEGDLLQSLHRLPPHLETLMDLERRLEFSDLADVGQKLAAAINSGSKSDLSGGVEGLRAKFTTIFSRNLKQWGAELSQQRELSLDLETTDLDPLAAEIVGVAICWNSAEGFYIPLLHTTGIPAGEELVSWQDLSEILVPILENPQIIKVGQNLKFDLEVLLRHGIHMQGIGFDSMIAAYVLNPDRRSYGLDNLSIELLGHRTIKFSDIVEKGGNFRDVSVGVATEYAVEDALVAWRLRECLQPRLERENLSNVFSELEVPLIPILAKMELWGIKLDTHLLAQLSAEAAKALGILEEQVVSIVGESFNLNSPKQLSQVLFDKLGLPTKGLKRTKTGVSTDSTVLEKLAELHPLPPLVLEYRALQKLKGTYLDALPVAVSPVTGRLHTRFHQTGTGTGRLSSSDPNLQNIPVQSELGRKIRAAFVAEDGWMLVSADYSQIELRLLAHLSGDASLIDAFARGLDIHEQTAREILNIPPTTGVSGAERRIGKTINFGVIYGMSAFRLARDLGVSVSEAQSFISGYFSRYSGVKEYFRHLEEQAEKAGEVRTVLGRRRLVAEIDAAERDQGFVARATINAPLQGSAADVVKLAMLRVDSRITSEALEARLLLQIHDELVLECPESEVVAVTSLLREEMENVMQLKVPLLVDVRCGRSWLEVR